MRMSDFVVRDAINPDLKAATKDAAIREMVENLKAAGYFKNADCEDLVKAILKREQLGSTGIGRSVAIPHTKHASVERLIGTVAISRSGIPFESVDGEAVHLLVLLISPQDRPGDHLRALENISRQLRDDTFCKFLKQATTADDIRQLLEEADNNGFVS